MSKRDKKLNINKLNRLNEEDESVFLEANDEKNKKLEDQNKLNLAQEISLEYQKLRGQIDEVFKLVPYCEPNIINLIDTNEKRLEFLEQALINRLILNDYENHNESKSFKISSAAYGTYLSQSFNSTTYSNHKESDLFEKLLNLNNLNLNNECLAQFSIKKLLKSYQKPKKSVNLDESKEKNEQNEKREESEPEQEEEEELDDEEMDDEENEDEENEEKGSSFSFKSQDHFNLIQNMNKIKYLNLSKNSLKAIPIKLVNKFDNLELIDISENLFESINLISLTKFSGLKELNLSNNMLRSFSTHEASNSISESEKDDKKLIESIEKLSTSLFVSLERLNLSNNQLISSNCLIISQFRNLKYLNLSNNNFVINETQQLPWQLMNNHLYNLIELNLSKNNKNIDISPRQTQTQTQTHIQPTQTFKPVAKARPESVFSNQSSSVTNPSRLNNRTLKSFNCLLNLKILDLSENNLVNVPNDIKDLKYLEELILDKNNIEFIPNELTELKRLKTLSLSDNRLNELNENFCGYAKFKETFTKLDLSKNNLKYDTLTYKIGLFDKLKSLNLAENNFEFIPNTLPKSLEELNLSKNKLKVLMVRPLSQTARADDEILIALDLEEHTSLKRGEKNQNINLGLSLSKRKTSNLTENLYDQPDVDQLEELALPHVFYLRNLKKLHLAYNSIQDIPADFGILNSSLEYLDISNNVLTQINISLCRGLGSLKYLNLSSNRIRDITDKIRELSELEYLNLSFNRLLNLNYELCNELKNLKELYLNNNYIENLPLFVPNKKSNTESAKHGVTRTPSAATRSNTPHSNLQSALSSASVKRKTQHCFNLPNLAKIDLSFNKFNSHFSLYTAFALSSKLVEIHLSSNRISFLDTDNISFVQNPQESQSQEFFDDEKIKKLSTPKHKLNCLKLLNLSNNELSFTKGGFIRLLCNIYKICPNLNTFLYDQLSGNKLGTVLIPQSNAKTVSSDKLSSGLASKSVTQLINNSANLISMIDEDYYFDFNENENPEEDQSGVNEFVNGKNETYESLLNRLETIDLSNNNLKKLPAFLYKLNNLKQLYFNGNFLKKIPNELFQLPQSNEEDANFERLKKMQEQRIKEQMKLKKKQNDDDNEDEEPEEEEEVKPKKKKNKKKSKQEPPKIDPIADQENAKDLKEGKSANLLSDTLEVVHLNNNQIENVPQNLFSHFRSLKEIKLKNNPLKEPPQESICISASTRLLRNEPKLLRNTTNNKAKEINLFKKSDIRTTIALLEKSSNSFTQKSYSNLNTNLMDYYTISSDQNKFKNGYGNNNSNLPNLFFEANENLKPLQTYMIKYKTREDMMLCNMFLIIKDNIDSVETLLKLMRRLKMPMDRVNYVCKEIYDSVVKNWNKISQIEYPPEPGKLRMSKKELNKKMHEYILRLQTWNLLNAWRSTFGTDAQSDELIRIFKLMNSNQYENDLYEKLSSFKLSSSMFRV